MSLLSSSTLDFGRESGRASSIRTDVGCHGTDLDGNLWQELFFIARSASGASRLHYFVHLACRCRHRLLDYSARNAREDGHWCEDRRCQLGRRTKPGTTYRPISRLFRFHASFLSWPGLGRIRWQKAGLARQVGRNRGRQKKIGFLNRCALDKAGAALQVH